MRLRFFRPTRMSIRLALGLVAIAAAGLSWIVHRARVQQAGIELIQQHGGMYYYDFEYEDAKFPKRPTSWVPDWLLRPVGVDYFHNVAWVRIENRQFDDES